MQIIRFGKVITLMAVVVGTFTLPTVTTTSASQGATPTSQAPLEELYDFNEYRATWAEEQKALLDEYANFVEDEDSKEGLNLPRLDEIKEEVLALHEVTLKEKVTPIILETLFGKAAFGFMLPKENYELKVAELDESLTEETATLDSLKEEWTTVIADEQARLKAEAERIAAEKRAQEEAAARAAQEAQQQSWNGNNNSGGGGANYSSAPAPAPAPAPAYDNQSRLNRAIAELGLPLPGIGIGNSGCSGYVNVLGCYNPNSQYIEITPYAFSYGNDCQLKFVIAHEYRHHYQNLNNMYKFDGNGNYANSAELEADANSFAYGYGCGV